MTQTGADDIRRGATIFMVGAGATVVCGVLLQSVVQPSTDISDKMSRYPWSNNAAFVAVSLLYMAIHLLVVAGLVTFERSGVAGTSRTARGGVGLSVIGTFLLAAGEAASLPIRNAHVDDPSAGIVGAVFALGVLVSAVGLLAAGRATLSARCWHAWRRYTLLVAGVWTTALVGISVTKALPAGVAIYGLCLLGMAIALSTQPAPTAPAGPPAFAGLTAE